MLYTGDFRWEPTSKRAQIGRTMLLNALNNERVDNLYLDNTYCNPSYSFPSREIAARQVVDIIISHPEHQVVIGIDSLGKEDLLLYISRVLKIKIWVWPERLQIMHLLGFHDIFTTKASLTRVRAVPRYSFSMDTLEGLNTMNPTIGIMPSGLPWVTKTMKTRESPFGSPSKCHRKSESETCNNKKKPKGCLETVERHHRYMYTVPYSDHSCFEELQEFVKLLRPVNMKCIVSSASSYVDPLYYFGHLSNVNQPSWSLHRKVDSKEGGERDEAIHTRHTPGRVKSADARTERRKTILVDSSSFRLSRVNLLRRARHGAKIVDLDSLDS